MAVRPLISKYGLENHGLTNVGETHWNYNTPALYEEIIRNGEGRMAQDGPIVLMTGAHTGRAAKEKFIVDEQENHDKVWWGKVNKSISEEVFENMHRRLRAYFQNRPVYIQDCMAGADAAFRLPVRVVTEKACHSLFTRTMLLQPSPEELENHVPEYTILHAPGFQAIPELDGTYSQAFIFLNLKRKMVLIGGTAYGGEIKKSVFTILNFLLPQQDVLSMHCSANVGTNNDVALFFGLSGTGKTTLSADPNRKLIGDDEHGWSANGVFNFEAGCYAKVIKLSAESEPEIYATTKRFGTLLENVGFDDITRRIDLNDDSITENTRAAYPLTHIPNTLASGMAGHPNNVIMLTADAFGVMPPISKLTPEQAMYHFISGYTAKLAGTEAGVTEPQATFSACFGAPFMVLHPSRYAELLAQKIKDHKASCWLVNTGWSGGPYGEGARMKIEYTRALLNAALDGSLNEVKYREDPVFGVQVPTSCPGVPEEILNPRNTWDNKQAYDEKASHLAGLFHENFRQFEDQAPQEVKAAGPKFPAMA